MFNGRFWINLKQTIRTLSAIRIFFETGVIRSPSPKFSTLFWRELSYQANLRTFLYDQLTSFFFCLLRRMVSKVHLTKGGGSEVIHNFDVTGNGFLCSVDSTRETHFCEAVLKVVKANSDVENSTESFTPAVATAVSDEFWNRFLESTQRLFGIDLRRIMFGNQTELKV